MLVTRPPPSSARCIVSGVRWPTGFSLPNAAESSFQAFPIDTRQGARAKARKLDEERDVLRSSRSVGDRYCLLKNTGGRNWPDRALRRQFRLNLVAENASLLCAI